jgi:hypothetical protein
MEEPMILPPMMMMSAMTESLYQITKMGTHGGDHCHRLSSAVMQTGPERILRRDQQGGVGAREGASVTILDIQEQAGAETVRMIKDMAAAPALSTPMFPTAGRSTRLLTRSPRRSGYMIFCSITREPSP